VLEYNFNAVVRVVQRHACFFDVGFWHSLISWENAES
jgi:hypothetical protein